jgi:ribosomal protein S18 acetylase RimI-like enzyme
MSINIKLASVENIDLLLPLVTEFHHLEGVMLSEAQRKSSLEALLAQDPPGQVWLICFETQPVGYIVICFGYSIEFTGRDAFIDEFYIRPEDRGKGLGQQALERIKTIAKGLDIQALHLEVLKSNLQAQGFYAKLGFEARDQYMLMSVKL